MESEQAWHVGDETTTGELGLIGQRSRHWSPRWRYHGDIMDNTGLIYILNKEIKVIIGLLKNRSLLNQ